MDRCTRLLRLWSGRDGGTERKNDPYMEVAFWYWPGKIYTTMIAFSDVLNR